MRRCCCRYQDKMSIKYDELINMLKKNSICIIDVRSRQEYAEGHIDGAINIPVCDIGREISKYELNKDSIIVVYCSAGYRSRKAQNILNMNGYTRVYNLIN